MFCAHSREYWLSRTAEGGGGMGKRKRKEKEQMYHFLSSRFLCIFVKEKPYQQMHLRFVIKQDWKEWGFWSIKQTAQPSWSPDNSGMHIPCMWMKITGCFEGARKNAKWSHASPIFLPGTENASLECFPFPFKFYLLLNEHYNSFKRNDYRGESSTIQPLWDTSCFLPMSLSVPYLRCALIWHSWNHSVDDISKTILKTVSYISTLSIISISFSWLHYIPFHSYSSPGHAQYSALNDFTTADT